MTSLRAAFRLLSLLVLLAAGATAATGGEVQLRSGACLYAGHPHHCTRLGTFDYRTVRDATPEWQTICRERVQPGSARHHLLLQALHERLVAEALVVARLNGCDLIVRHDDLKPGSTGTAAPIDVTAMLAQRVAQP